MEAAFLHKLCAWLDLLLQRQVLRLRTLRDHADDRFRGLYIADAEVDALLAETNPPLNEVISNLELQLNLLECDLEEQLAASPHLPLAQLIASFGLSALEWRALVIAFATELDLRFQTLFAYVQNDVTRKSPSVDLTLKLLCATKEDQWAARAIVTQRGPLIRDVLIRLVNEDNEHDSSLLAKSLRISRRVAGFLLGSKEIAATLCGIAETVVPRAEAVGPAELLAAARLLRSGGVAILRGRPGSGRRQAAEALCRDLKMNLLVCDPRRARDPAALGPLLRRECLLANAALFLHFDDAADAEARGVYANLAWQLQEAPFPLFIGTGLNGPPISLDTRSTFRFDLPIPGIDARRGLWRQELNGVAATPEIEREIPTLAGKFRFTPGQIRDVVSDARNLARIRGGGDHTASLHDIYSAARVHGTPGLHKLAHRCELLFEWRDLVLPDRVLEQLREVVNSVRYRHIVHAGWGFDRKVGKNAGISVMFSGASGTGKTMAASVMARELNLDLYRIDLSTVVSKYVGETEKQLKTIFSEAEHSSAILFFDEADALFGKRSEVKESNDRFSNIEVAFLLQEIEQFSGFSILATNISRNIDPAFTRRMQHVIEFPFPDAVHRERIWRGMIPPEAPVADDVDFAFLARQFELSGGNIRNVVTAAAFLAAAAGGPLSMEHLARATGREFQKMGRLPSKSDFQEHFATISAMIGAK